MNVQQILQALKSGQLSADQAKNALGQQSQSGAAQPQAPTSQPIKPTAEEKAPYVEPTAAAPIANTPIAIVGKAGCYPGANDLNEFWQNLCDGEDSVTSLNTNSCDETFFAQQQSASNTLTPKQLLILQQTYKACEDGAFIAPAAIASRCGVYLATSDNSGTTMAANIASVFNFTGGAIAINTEASSFLVATHLACQALRSQQIDMALVGAFKNANAEQIAPGEGLGVVILKRLSDAKNDEDHINALIVGSGMNQNISLDSCSSQDASQESQSELLRQVYNQHGINPANIGYVEVDGFNSEVDDLVELNALTQTFTQTFGQTFTQSTDNYQYCAIDSVKHNIGHTGEASGLAALHKVILSMQHSTLLPNLAVQKQDIDFDFAQSPFYLNTQCKPWPLSHSNKRQAAISSFGASGTNAHLVLEQFDHQVLNSQQSDNKLAAKGPHLFVLSAHTAIALQHYAKQMLEHLEQYPDPNLADLTYTLQVGRQAREYRLAIVFDRVFQLRLSLRHFLMTHSEENVNVNTSALTSGISDDEFFFAHKDEYPHQVERFEQRSEFTTQTQQWFDKRELVSLAKWWVKGVNIDWIQLRADSRARKIPLPTYPFVLGSVVDD